MAAIQHCVEGSVEFDFGIILHEQRSEDLVRQIALSFLDIQLFGIVGRRPVKGVVFVGAEYTADSESKVVALGILQRSSGEGVVEHQTQVLKGRFRDHDINRAIGVGGGREQLSAHQLNMLRKIFPGAEDDTVVHALIPVVIRNDRLTAQSIMLYHLQRRQVKERCHLVDLLGSIQSQLISDGTVVCLDGNLSGVQISLVQIVRQLLLEIALLGSLDIHGIGACDAHEQNVADQKCQHQPLFVEHFLQNKFQHKVTS